MSVSYPVYSSQLGHLATTILHNKNYSHLNGGNRESWAQIADRVVTTVVKPYLPHLVEPIKKLVEERKLMPGGRYLYAAGRKYPQLNSCFLFKAEDSREGWGKTLNDCCNALMTGGGIGVVYTPLRAEGQTIAGLGGKSTGPLALMKMVNECGRYIIQGGSRRSAIWAGLHWNHPDIFGLIGMKDWSDTIHNCRREDFNFPAPVDGTNISVILDDLFFTAYDDTEHVLHNLAQSVYWQSIEHMLRTGEPGFSVDIGDNDGENLRNACTEVSSRDSGDMCLAVGTRVLTDVGYMPIEELADSGAMVATKTSDELEFQHPSKVFCSGIKDVYWLELRDRRRILLTGNHPVLTKRGWKKVDELTLTDSVLLGTTPRYDHEEATELDDEFYMLGWLVGDGWFSDNQFGFVFGSDEDKESEDMIVKWMRDKWDIGCIQEQPNGVRCLHIGSKRMQSIFSSQYGIKPGRAPKKRVPTRVFTETTARKRSFLAGLFAADGSAKRKRQAGLASASAELLRDVQLLLDEDGMYSHIGCIDPKEGRDHSKAGWLTVAGESVFRFINVVGFGYHKIKHELLLGKLTDIPLTAKGEIYHIKSSPNSIGIRSITHVGMSEVYDVSLEKHHHFVAEGMIVHNCNLGSINISRINSLEEFATVVELGTAFLLCGTLYSKLPLPEMYKIREKNRRLGLGLMGVHDWLLRRAYRYEANDELKSWMETFAMSDAFAHRWADKLSISRPVATRSIAPTGTISIVAETTSGIEPIFASAYKRRYLEGKNWKMQYKIDAAAQRLVDSGVDPELIEDSYTLAEDVERRIGFQVFIQRYVNHSVSSTINLPEWGSSLNNESKIASFGKTLMSHLPGLRGITVYPNGSRGGQPLVRAPYGEAIKHLGKEYIENCESDGNGIGSGNNHLTSVSDGHSKAPLDLSPDSVIEYSNENGCKGGVCGA